MAKRITLSIGTGCYAVYSADNTYKMLAYCSSYLLSQSFYLFQLPSAIAVQREKNTAPRERARSLRFQSSHCGWLLVIQVAAITG